MIYSSCKYKTTIHYDAMYKNVNIHSCPSQDFNLECSNCTSATTLAITKCFTQCLKCMYTHTHTQN